MLCVYIAVVLLYDQRPTECQWLALPGSRRPHASINRVHVPQSVLPQKHGGSDSSSEEEEDRERLAKVKRIYDEETARC